MKQRIRLSLRRRIKKPGKRIKFHFQYLSLSPEIDKHFGHYIANCYSEIMLKNKPINDAVKQITEVLLPEFFRKYGFKYLSSMITKDKPVVEKFFNNLTHIWQFFMQNRLYIYAQEYWKVVLDLTIEWQCISGLRIHKGTILYFWGVSALENNEIDKGYRLIHSAYSEDVATTKESNPDTPAHLHIVMNPDPRQFYSRYVVKLTNYLNDEYIVKFNQIASKKIDIAELQKKFLFFDPLREWAFLFSYLIAYHYSNDTFFNQLTRSEFNCQHLQYIFFMHAVLIESLIKSKDIVHNNLPGYLHELSEKSKLTIKQDEIQQFDTSNKTKNEVEVILSGILRNRGIAYKRKRAMPRALDYDIALVYALRNLVAHNIFSIDAIFDNFFIIRQRMMNVFFLTVQNIL